VRDNEVNHRISDSLLSSAKNRAGQLRSGSASLHYWHCGCGQLWHDATDENEATRRAIRKRRRRRKEKGVEEGSEEETKQGGS
jgi:hypothetical protein